MKLVTAKPPLYPNITVDEIHSCLPHLYEPDAKDRRIVDSFYFKKSTSFEDEICDYLGTNHCFVTNSGYTSIFLALLAAGVTKHDEVITTPISWGQTLSPIVHIGALPIFADIDPNTFQISYDAIVEAYSPRTKAVLVVNLYGSCPELHKIRAFCDEHSLIMIEDSAQSMGRKYGKNFTGTIGHIGAFSFNSGKLLPIGGAGAVVTDSEDLYNKIIYYGSKSTHKNKIIGHTDLSLEGLDYTFLCHPILQEIGRVKLNQLDEMNEIRQNNMNFLRKELNDIKSIQLQSINDYSDVSVYMFSFKNLAPIKLDKLFDLFKRFNIPRFTYNPKPLCDITSDRFPWYTPFIGSCSNATDLCNREVCITSYRWITERQDYLRQYSDAFHYCYEQLERRL